MPSPNLTLLALSLLLCLPVRALAEGQLVQFLGLRSEVPSGWVREEPASTMRVLQYSVPAADGAEGAQFVVYYFGPGQGGSVEANVERWQSQFSRPDGSEVKAAVSRLEKAEMPATLVELEGTYARGVGMGPTGEAQPDRMLLAAVVETPKGNIYVQLHGPAGLVKAERAGFVAFVEGLAPDSAS